MLEMKPKAFVKSYSLGTAGRSGEQQSATIPRVQSVAHTDANESTRRDFLYVATAAVGGIGACAVAVPLINQMNPSADVLALSSIEVDLAPIQPGQSVTFTWRSHPLFVRRRTPEEIEAARAVNLGDLIDSNARSAQQPDGAPATDENRVVKPEWLVVVGVCTHLGCTPEASSAQNKQGDFGGWLCHCHGSQYDTSGRVRVGPAPENLSVPPYAFLSDTRMRIG
jgi:ubiquinol-cytochrome c reductase iron-sulfur subunit